jgi:hypothetical protein
MTLVSHRSLRPSLRAARPVSARPVSALVPLGAALAMLLALHAPAQAQVHRYGAGWTAGGSYLTELNSGARGQVGQPATQIAPGMGFVFGLHVDRWYGADGRIGVRYQGAYQQPRVDWVRGERKIDQLSADASVLFRVLEPGEHPDQVLPYLALGFGGVWYDLGTRGETSFPAGDAYHDGSSRILPAGIVGIGADVPLPWGWQGSPVRLRLEIADHISIGSPIRQISDGSRYGAVHHVRFTVGAYSVLDIRR